MDNMGAHDRLKPCRISVGLRWAGLASALTAVLVVAGCRRGGSGGPVQPAVPVLAGTVQQRDVPIQVRNIGTVEAYSTVAVKTLIGGQLVKVHIKEGQAVKKGDALYTIDPRPYQAALNQAEANLAHDTVEYDNAVRDAKRVETLFKQNVSSQDELDTAQTKADSLAAAIKADKAAIEITKIQLSYCQIDSPIDGATGSLLVNEGNIIKANDATLITINQVQPIYVSFAVPQQYLPEIRKYQDQGPLAVDVFTIKENEPLATGKLAFIDNAIDLATGTIRLKGVFPNSQVKLWPGQLVTAVLTLTVEKGALVVPSQAVQTGQEGRFIYVIEGDLTVRPQKIDIERTLENDTVIRGDFQPGQRIVTDGQLRLFPGAKVEIKPTLTSTSPATQEAKGS